MSWISTCARWMGAAGRWDLLLSCCLTTRQSSWLWPSRKFVTGSFGSHPLISPCRFVKLGPGSHQFACIVQRETRKHGDAMVQSFADERELRALAAELRLTSRLKTICVQGAGGALHTRPSQRAASAREHPAP